jgi:hypothetical protein
MPNAAPFKNYGLHDGTTRRPGFLSKNPNGRVPLLEFEDGRTLAESDAILHIRRSAPGSDGSQANRAMCRLKLPGDRGLALLSSMRSWSVPSDVRNCLPTVLGKPTSRDL